MKKVVLFCHGKVYNEFLQGGFLHRKYENKSGQKISWQAFSGHLTSKEKNFDLFQKALKNADIFICDSDNTNLDIKTEGESYEIEDQSFDNLIEAIIEIRKNNKKLKIFIKDLPYTPKEQINELSLYGEIVRYWFDEKILADLK